MMRIAIAVSVSLAAGCGPALGGLPHPNNAIAAGAAAATAGAITIANPALAGHKPEADIDAEGNAHEVHTTVPSDVLDRVDHPSAPEDPQPAPPPNAPPPAAPDMTDAGGNDYMFRQ